MDPAHQMTGRGPFSPFLPLPPFPPLLPPILHLNKLMSGPSVILLPSCSIERKLLYLTLPSLLHEIEETSKGTRYKPAGATECFPKQLLIYIQKSDDLLDRGYKYSLQHPLSLACSKQDLDKQNKLLLLLLKKRNDRNIAECLQPD